MTCDVQVTLPLQNIFSPSMKCGGWSQFDPKFSNADVLNAFMDAAAAAAANSRAMLTQSPPLDDVKGASGGLAGESGFALTFSAFDDRHRVRDHLTHRYDTTFPAVIITPPSGMAGQVSCGVFGGGVSQSWRIKCQCCWTKATRSFRQSVTRLVQSTGFRFMIRAAVVGSSQRMT